MSKELVVNYENKPCYKIKTRNNFDDLAASIKEFKPDSYNKICIVTDDLVSSLYLNEVKAALEPICKVCINFVFPNGEASKNLSIIEKLYEELIINHFDRQDLLVALGGGVVGDMTGFAAATYLRGIDFIQIPTTLLSQVDSSIGGKTGVDYLNFKNMVGAFYMPRLVYINISTLKTLPKEQFESGMGEVIKHSFIRNAEYLSYLKDNSDIIKAMDMAALEEVVYGSNLVKREIVELDPKEKNIRGYLNFGHTIGHAVEKLMEFKLSHGACVAIGMVSSLYLSFINGDITEQEYISGVNMISSYGLPTSVSGLKPEDVLAATKSDKKMVGNKVKFILLKSVGDAYINTELSDDILLSGIKIICK